MKQVAKFHIGMYDKKMENQIVHPEEILEVCKEEFEGFTAYESKGGWKGKTENSLTVEVVGLSRDEAEDVKSWMEEEFNQESVMVQLQQAEVMF